MSDFLETCQDRRRRRRVTGLSVGAGLVAVAITGSLIGWLAVGRDAPADLGAPPGGPVTGSPLTGSPLTGGAGTSGPLTTVPGPTGGTPAGDETAGGTAMQQAAARVATEPISVRYTFDAGPGAPIVDSAGRYPLREAAAAGGAVTFLARGQGWSVGWPPRCGTEPKSCPRAILQGARADELNPGTRPVQFGASVQMTADDTGDGANVLQKGYSVGGGTQFKLQVDHAAGRPSCVIASAGRIYPTVASVRVADGDWHQLTCTRRGSTLTITVDGTVRGSVRVPPTLSIVNAEPLRVGGKGPGAGNDQFAGRMDDVFLTIG